MPVVWVTPDSPAEAWPWDARSITALSPPLQPLWVRAGGAAGLIASCHRQADPSHASTLFHHVPLAAVPLTMCRSTTISGQNYSAPAGISLVSSTANSIQQPPHLPWGVAGSPQGSIRSDRSLSNVVAVATYQPQSSLQKPQSIASNSENNQHHTNFNTLHPSFFQKGKQIESKPQGMEIDLL